MEKKELRKIAKAIKLIDEINVSEKENLKTLIESRAYLISIIFSNGYKLEYKTYKLIKL
jgi:hypothetical protein